MEKKRSVGVTLFGIFFLIAGIYSLPNVLMRGLAYYNIANQIDTVLFGYSIFICGAFITIGIGVLFLKKWARYLAILVALILICENIKLLFDYSSLTAQAKAEKLYGIFNYIAIIFNIIVLFFFTRPKVKEQFK